MAKDDTQVELTDVVLIGDGTATRKVRINGTEFDVAGANPLMQGGAVGVALTLVNVRISSETVAPAQPQMAPTTGSAG